MIWSSTRKLNSRKRRKELYSLLGDLPDRNRPITAEIESEEDKDHYVLQKLRLDLNGFEPVPAYFAKPKGLTGAAPAILYNHYHGSEYELGKEELLQNKDPSPAYAEALTAAGYCALCIDAWGFGERNTRTELDLFKDMLWHGRTLWGMMVYDSLRAVDYLCSRAEVDPARIGTLGMSMGSTMAWWLAALDERIKVCVDICCLTDFHTLLEQRHLKGHGIYYFVPSLLKYFTTAQINALIAPRPHLSLAGNLDLLTPVKGLEIIDQELQQIYRMLGCEKNWQLLRYDVGHVETREMRQEIMNFLKIHL